MRSTDALAVGLQQLMSCRGVSVQVVGVGSGNGHPIHIVCVGSLPQRSASIPKNFDGVPVKVVRTGEIRPARSA